MIDHPTAYDEIESIVLDMDLLDMGPLDKGPLDKGLDDEVSVIAESDAAAEAVVVAEDEDDVDDGSIDVDAADDVEADTGDDVVDLDAVSVDDGPAADPGSGVGVTTGTGSAIDVTAARRAPNELLSGLRDRQRAELVALLFAPVDELPAHLVGPRKPLFAQARTQPSTLVPPTVGVEDTGKPLIGDLPILPGDQLQPVTPVAFVPATPASSRPLILRVLAILIVVGVVGSGLYWLSTFVVSAADTPSTSSEAVRPSPTTIPAQRESSATSTVTAVSPTTLLPEPPSLEPAIEQSTSTPATDAAPVAEAAVVASTPAAVDRPAARPAAPRPTTTVPRRVSSTQPASTPTSSEPTAVTNNDGLVVPPPVSGTPPKILHPDNPEGSAPTQAPKPSVVTTPSASTPPASTPPASTPSAPTPSASTPAASTASASTAAAPNTGDRVNRGEAFLGSGG